MPDFAEIKRAAGGMLAAETYGAVYDAACGVEKGDILEIGTAHGAATIALARGLKDRGHDGKVLTIDKISGGSREAFGDVEANLRIINGNFDKFDVAGKIDFHVGTSWDIAAQLPEGLEIGLLMLDADGAIDRDFRLFYNAVLPGSPIIIDDYMPDFVRLYRRGRTVRVDQKRRLTALLIHYFEEKGLLHATRLVGETWFGKKPERVTGKVEFDLGEIAEVYRRLTFADAELHNPLAEFIGNATRKFPGLHKALKRIYTK
jgi:predicted O-methyltransferase YrrM